MAQLDRRRQSASRAPSPGRAARGRDYAVDTEALRALLRNTSFSVLEALLKADALPEGPVRETVTAGACAVTVSVHRPAPPDDEPPAAVRLTPCRADML